MTVEAPENYYQAIGNELNAIVREPWGHMEDEVPLDEISAESDLISNE